jgi:crotonobetainyl-CoA:carnitine CoA-transferase CaiB-like acyl-CoA transferase
MTRQSEGKSIPDEARPGPLSGIRVLDMTAVVLGPLATQMLGDMGADVIKVEPPEGDVLRSNGVHRTPNMGSVFLSINRNKRSLAVDLKSERGREIVERLVARSDVVVHNMRVAAMEKLGLGYERLRTIKPDIVYCVATGFSQAGPDRNKPAFDDIIQAACGLALLGREEPDYIPTLIADKTAGMALANAVLAALLHRERTGEGQYVEVPMFETMVAFVLTEHLGGMTFEPPLSPPGYDRLLSGGRLPAPTSDGYIAMLPYTGDHWAALFESAGRADLVEKYRVHERDARNTFLKELYREMQDITRRRTTAEWLAVCAELDIPATPIYRLHELMDHPQLRAVGMFQTASHPTQGAVRYLRPATNFSRSPASVRMLAPELGQHTAEILADVGYTEREIRQFVADKVVVRAPEGREGAPSA